jgi:DNA-binding XRE family transcriptional regulator
MGEPQSSVADVNVAGVERMSSIDKPRIITQATALDGGTLRLVWSDGTKADIDLSATLKKRAFAALNDLEAFAKVHVGDWGHSVEWACGTELGTDSLWLETLSSTGRDDVRRFLEWRLQNGLSLAKAAEALGISRRTVACYSNGERAVPKAILLACTGWEVGQKMQQAA